MTYSSFRFFLLLSFLSFGAFANTSDSTIINSQKLELKINAQLWKQDSTWAAEQFSFQGIQADTFLLNEFNYNKDDIPIFSDSVLISRLQLLNENTPFQLDMTRCI